MYNGDYMNIIELLKYIFLGFIQGITEPIPVSSSGHLLIAKVLMERWFGDIAIDYDLLAIITNFGSLIAIIAIFWKDIISLIKDFFSFLKTKDKKYKLNFRYCLFLVIATIPAGICGLIVTKLKIFDSLESNVKFVGVMLLVTAIFLFLIRNIKGEKKDKNMTLKDAIIVGLFQVVALFPGISRSGATIVGGMTRKFTRETAFKFSFLLYIPISLATMILGISDLLGANLSAAQWIYYMSSMIIAGIFTYIGTKWFRKLVVDGKLIYFVIYCVVVGSLIILFV